MSNFNPDGASDNDWDERGELAWNEFDWEHYLREQDEVVLRYLDCYEKLRAHPERLDETAHLMGWDESDWSSDLGENAPEEDAAASAIEAIDDDEPYTLHKNPVFISTRAIYLGLKRAWEAIAADPAKIPQPLALTLHAALYRGEDRAMLAIQALDFGDYAMAISLLKRALGELNTTIAHLAGPPDASRAFQRFRDDALPRLFDLREIWLRVMHECRDELECPDEDDDE